MQKVLNWHAYSVEKNDIIIPNRFYSLKMVAGLNATKMKGNDIIFVLELGFWNALFALDFEYWHLLYFSIGALSRDHLKWKQFLFLAYDAK